MIIKNIETGKKYETTKAKWESMRSKKLFEVIQEDDEVKEVKVVKKPSEEKISSKKENTTEQKQSDKK